GAAEQVESELAKLRERAQAEVARRKEQKTPKPHGRRDLSLEDLPVEEITLEPPERLLPGGEALEKIGVEISEHIDRPPASNVRVRVIRPKYKMPDAAMMAQAAAATAAPERAGGPASDGGVVSETPAAPAEVVTERAKPGSIVIAELPERPIPRGIAGPGLLAHVLVSRQALRLDRHRAAQGPRRGAHRQGDELPRQPPRPAHARPR
ncbi:MAG: hypothetical protein ACJ79N_06350, partial [Gemmatimonadaceae bacterium]